MGALSVYLQGLSGIDVRVLEVMIQRRAVMANLVRRLHGRDAAPCAAVVATWLLGRLATRSVGWKRRPRLPSG